MKKLEDSSLVYALPTHVHSPTKTIYMVIQENQFGYPTIYSMRVNVVRPNEGSAWVLLHDIYPEIRLVESLPYGLTDTLNDLFRNNKPHFIDYFETKEQAEEWVRTTTYLEKNAREEKTLLDKIERLESMKDGYNREIEWLNKVLENRKDNHLDK